MPHRLLIAATVGVLTLAPRVARAEGEAWTRGVTPEAKKTAQRLLEEGNQLFLANDHKAALERYTAAVRAWDHPAIRFNMVRAQVSLDRLIEAADNLEKALAYGSAPLEDTVYQEALNYQRMLARQISELVVTAAEPGVTIKVDGELVPAGTGPHALRKLPGRHLVLATAPGRITAMREVVLVGGEHVTVALHLPRTASTGPRWARWKPWAVVMGGAALAGVGLAYNVIGRRHADEVDQRTRTACPTGCTEAEYASLGLAALEHTVHRDNAISLTTLGVGGAALLVGGALVILNRPSAERAIVTVDGQGAGVALLGRF